MGLYFDFAVFGLVDDEWEVFHFCCFRNASTACSIPFSGFSLFHFPAAYQRLEESVRHYSIHKADEYNKI
jgi:hypothetical protein